MLGHRLLERNRSLLMFDEIEDLFSWDFHGSRRDAKMSKLWFNRLLEQNPVPTIWISNDMRGVDRAFLRRFQYAIEFQPLTAGMRGRILRRHFGKRSHLSPDDVHAIATRFPSSSAQYASAVNATRALVPGRKPGREHIERLLLPIEKLLTGSEPRVHHSRVSSYRLDVLHTAADLNQIADQLASWQPSADPGVSLCLYGPPGTGKSAFADHLAQRMGRPLLHKRASDLLGPYVGQTEAAVAAAFREAERDRAVLLFDEADSFMRNRRSARQSWEATLVNEFLQQLEAFRGVVVCTTNLNDELDAAAARRFTFNIEFRHLRAEQTVMLFERTFVPDLVSDWSSQSREKVGAALASVSNLAPGDYAALARRTKTLGCKLSVDELLSGLIESARAKSSSKRSVGFVK